MHLEFCFNKPGESNVFMAKDGTSEEILLNVAYNCANHLVYQREGLSIEGKERVMALLNNLVTQIALLN